MHDSDHPGKNFHEASKYRYDPGFVEPPPSEWPEEWKTTYYKSYPRFEAHPLPHPHTDTNLATLLSARKSERQHTKKGLDLQTLSNLLFCACGEVPASEKKNRRVYASGGARYPLETYVILRRSSDDALTPGVYHYNVQNHTLEYLWSEKAAQPPLFTNEWGEDADAIVVLTAIFRRSTAKYGERGYRFVYFDAGAILQNLYLFAAEHETVKVTGCSGTNDDIIEALLRLNTDYESLVLTALIGS